MCPDVNVDRRGRRRTRGEQAKELTCLKPLYRTKTVVENFLVSGTKYNANLYEYKCWDFRKKVIMPKGSITRACLTGPIGDSIITHILLLKEGGVYYGVILQEIQCIQ